MKSSFLFGGFVVCLAMVGFGHSEADAKRLFNKGVEKATAEIAGCTDPEIQGRATLKERFTEEGIKEVEVSMFVKGLSDGKHAVHIHEAAACEPCSAAKKAIMIQEPLTSTAATLMHRTALISIIRFIWETS